MPNPERAPAAAPERPSAAVTVRWSAAGAVAFMLAHGFVVAALLTRLATRDPDIGGYFGACALAAAVNVAATYAVMQLTPRPTAGARRACRLWPATFCLPAAADWLTGLHRYHWWLTDVFGVSAASLAHADGMLFACCVGTVIASLVNLAVYRIGDHRPETGSAAEVAA